MIRPKILIAGATGKTCSTVARTLLRDRWPIHVLPFYPANDLKAYERRMGFDTPERTTLSVDDERWQLDHKAQRDEQGIERAGRTMPATKRGNPLLGTRPIPS